MVHLLKIKFKSFHYNKKIALYDLLQYHFKHPDEFLNVELYECMKKDFKVRLYLIFINYLV